MGDLEDSVPFHAGELKLQKVFDEEAKAQRIAFSLRHGFVQRTAGSLHAMTLLVITSRSGTALDVHLVSGPQGFLEAVDDRTLVITPDHPLPDSLVHQLSGGAAVGTTGIDFDTGARVRVNGRAHVRSRSIVVQTDEVFPNCKMHVERRVERRPDGPVLGAQTLKVAAEDLAEFVAGARMLFVCSEFGDGDSLDVAHRSGPPGFATLDGHQIRFEDYYGNGMYQTLGNLDVCPRATVAVVDLAEGIGHLFQGTTRLEIEPTADRRWVVLGVESASAMTLPATRWDLAPLGRPSSPAVHAESASRAGEPNAEQHSRADITPKLKSAR